MARLEGGIFSRPRGKTGGVVFGAARSRTGKQVTSRLLVAPSNPNTPDQQDQRGKFKYVLNTVRGIPAATVSDVFNRGVAQLPGFQSMMSALLNNIDANKDFTTTPAEMLTGQLPWPGTFSVSEFAAGVSTITWSNETGGGKLSTDRLNIVNIAALDSGSTGGLQEYTIPVSGETRASSPYAYEPSAGDDFGALLAIWWDGAPATANAGAHSSVRFFKLAAGA